MKRIQMILLLVGLSLVFGCAGKNSTSGDGKVADAGIDSTQADSIAGDSIQADSNQADSNQGDMGSSPITNEFGFWIRVPQKHTVPCPDGPANWLPDQISQLDQDWICTFDHGGTTGHIYLKNTASSCKTVMTNVPYFTNQGAFISQRGLVTTLANAEYSWGGNHHNDSLEFDHDGKHFQYAHSSVDFSFRSCQAMDCIMIYESKSGTIIENGCTKERTLPIVCKLVVVGQIYGIADFVDEFEICEGDPNYR